MPTFFVKDPDEVLDYQENWATWLGSDTISASSWIVPAGITKDSDTNTTTTATIWFSVGSVGQIYNIVNRIVTAGGRTADRSIAIFVKERVGEFSYRGDLMTDRDKVRFSLQDTAEDSGPKPNGGNFTDQELDGLVTLEGEWQRAVAAGFEALAAIWAQYADLSEGPHKESLSQVADRHSKNAALWRARSGSARPARVAGIIRVDGYSDDIASDDVDVTSEYGIIWEYVRVKG